MNKVLFLTLVSSLITSLYLYLTLEYNLGSHSVINVTTALYSQFPLRISRQNYNENLLDIDWHNSTSLFNIINNALRRKGSDLNPNGVSFISAKIPEGTLLYHGTVNGKFPSNPEWVAMDPEFSYFFRNGLRKWRGRPPPKNKGEVGLTVEDASEKKRLGKFLMPDGESSVSGGSESNGSNKLENSHSTSQSNTMLTFITTKPLNRLILLDGASAAKTPLGEMDTQMLLSRMERKRWDHMEFRDEYLMAQKICEWGQPFGLDGIIRLEISFEVILCDFTSEKIELISNITYDGGNEFLGLPSDDSDYFISGKKDGSRKYKGVSSDEDSSDSILEILSSSSGYDHLKSGESRYNGDSRIQLDFRNIVTAINRTYLSPDPYTRRLNNITQETQDGMIDDIITMITTEYTNDCTNWQLITDGLITRFAPLFSTLNSTLTNFNTTNPSVSDIKTLGLNLTSYTYNIVRRHTNSESHDSALDWFTYEYSHPTHALQTEMELLIWSSIHTVSRRVGKEIFNTFQLSKDIISYLYKKDNPPSDWINHILDRVNTQKKSIITLLNDLNWTYYYQCSEKCQENELCMVPTWGPSPYRWRTIDKDGKRPKVGYSDLQCISFYDLL